MSVEHWLNDTDGLKLTYWEGTLSHSHIVQNESVMMWTEIKPGPSGCYNEVHAPRGDRT